MANVIKAFRILKGLNQEETAKLMGMGIANYNTKENNPDLFTVAEVKKLTSILNVPHNIFFDSEVNLKVTI
jgi:transcriptional regulator with XRE-family HTH domain